jgi:hypothetical protein
MIPPNSPIESRAVLQGHDEPRPMPHDANEYAQRYSLTTFINAYYQIRDCMRYAPSSILIVGVGVGLEPILLREKFCKQVTTLDIDPGFGVDLAGSVHDMKCIADSAYDMCIVSHVLEHLPFRYFEPSLREIARVARHALIYLPYGARHFEVKMTRAQRTKEYTLRLSLPRLRRIDGSRPILCGGEHYWECGYRGYSIRRIRTLMQKYFNVDSMYHNDDWHFSINYCLTSLTSPDAAGGAC